MTMENSVSFKVFLHKEGITEQPEVRRFGIDRDVVSNFNYLTQKLQAVFPSLQAKNFTIHWKDADGDSILITTDDELIIALTEMQTDVRKLYVVVKEPPKPQQEPKYDDTASANPVHTGVSCDGCGKGVQGFRYKCVQCPDFDLCSTCENANLHGEHFMIRVPVPISWRPHFGRRLAHHLSKSARKGGQTCGGWGSDAQEGSSCSIGSGPYPCHARGSHGRHREHHGPHGSNWLETLSSYLSEWTNLPGEAPTPSAAEGSEQEQKQQQQQQQDYAAEQHIKYLRSVGQTVANLLDPLGIDVDIEVRSKNDSGEKVPKENEGANYVADTNVPLRKNVSFAENATETSVKEVASQINDLTINNNAAEPRVEPMVGIERTSPESDDWTVVTGMESQQVNSPTPSSAVNAGAIPRQPFNAFPSPAAPGGFYETAHQAAMLGAQQAMAAHDAHMMQVNTEHEAAQRLAHVRGMLQMQQAREAGRKAAEENAYKQAQQVIAASGQNNLYPHLGIQAGALPPTSHMPQQAQRIVNHPQQHIDAAVDQMMSMGFTNEGGWLTQLLETQNGNITKALDILQPVKK